MKHNLLGYLCWLFLMFVSPVSVAKDSPTDVAGAQTVSVEQARDLWLDGVAFIDPRSLMDWEAGRIPDALHMEMKKPIYNSDTVLEFIGSYDAPVVSYCNSFSCHRAADLAKDMVNWGFTKVYYFRAGYPAWIRANNPFE